jgi:hypothetical protein
VSLSLSLSLSLFLSSDFVPLFFFFFFFFFFFMRKILYLFELSNCGIFHQLGFVIVSPSWVFLFDILNAISKP